MLSVVVAWIWSLLLALLGIAILIPVILILAFWIFVAIVVVAGLLEGGW